MLTPCESDQSCGEGNACVEHSVCLQPYEDRYYDYGEDEREEHGELEPPAADVLRSPGLLAGPMMPKKERAKPIFRYNAVNLCSREVACRAPGTCQPEKICVPKGSRALAYRGENVEPARVSRKTQTALTQSGSEPNEQPAAVRAGGCAGCSVADNKSGGWALAAAVGAALSWLVRKRRGN